MQLVDLLSTMSLNCRLVIYDIDNDYESVYDDTSLSLKRDFSSLLCRRVKSVDIDNCDNPINIDKNHTVDYVCSVDTYSPSIVDKIIGYIKFKVGKINRYDILVLLNKLLYGKYYIPLHPLLYDNKIDRELIGGYDKPGDIFVYTKNITDSNLFNLKTPIFRLRVINRVNDEEIPIPIFKPDIWPGDNIDTTMVFTLEKHPVPLQTYESVKRRLRGNIITEERVNELVEFVSLNYDELRRAWDIDTDTFGTLSKGFDESKLVSLNK